MAILQYLIQHWIIIAHQICQYQVWFLKPVIILPQAIILLNQYLSQYKLYNLQNCTRSRVLSTKIRYWNPTMILILILLWEGRIRIMMWLPVVVCIKLGVCIRLVGICIRMQAMLVIVLTTIIMLILIIMLALVSVWTCLFWTLATI